MSPTRFPSRLIHTNFIWLNFCCHHLMYCFQLYAAKWSNWLFNISIAFLLSLSIITFLKPLHHACCIAMITAIPHFSKHSMLLLQFLVLLHDSNLKNPEKPIQLYLLMSEPDMFIPHYILTISLVVWFKVYVVVLVALCWYQSDHICHPFCCIKSRLLDYHPLSNILVLKEKKISAFPDSPKDPDR